MNELARLFVNPYGLTYLAVLVSIQFLYRQWRKNKRSRIATQRLTHGLPATSLLSRGETLLQHQQRVSLEIALWVMSALVVPTILMAIARMIESDSQRIVSAQSGLSVMAAALLSLIAIGSIGPIRAMVSGFVFEAIAAFSVPFRPGDYIAIAPNIAPHNTHHSATHSTLPIQGKVIRFNAFLVTLENSKGQRINIPTHTLWRETVTVLNGRQRSSPFSSPFSSECKVVFYLSHTATRQQLRLAESVILEAIRNSAYLEPSSPIDIYYAQSLDAIEISAIAYVGAIENAAAFSSDITRQFLNLAQQKQLPLATAMRPSIAKYTETDC